MKLTSFTGLFFLSALAAFAGLPKIGDVAPPFAGQDQNGTTVQLSDFAGRQNVLLYFYPKDFTGGCTKEACGFRDRIGDLQTNNVQIIGVSYDSAESHKKFIAQYNLPFPLIADTNGVIVAAYDVKMPLMNLSKRVSFLIDTNGKIAHVTDSANPQTHFDEMQAAIASMPKGKR